MYNSREEKGRVKDQRRGEGGTEGGEAELEQKLPFEK